MEWWRVEKASQESCKAGPSSQPEVSSTQPLSSSSKLRAAAPPTDQRAAGTVAEAPSVLVRLTGSVPPGRLGRAGFGD